MKSLAGFFKLIRVYNLGYIVLTQVLLQFCLLVPLFALAKSCPGLEVSLAGFDFFLLVFSTVLIAASGYIINDYFDVKIDEINKPERILVNQVLARRKIMALHLVFNFIGLGIGFYLAWKIGNVKLGFLHLTAVCLLWFYSANFKGSFLIGNLVVSLLTGLVVLLVLAYEVQYFSELKTCNPLVADIVWQYFMGYAFFAFLITFIRELIKDMEDIKGDRAGDCRTLPIVLGIKNTKLITGGSILLLVTFLVFVQIRFFSNEHQTSVAYIFALIQTPVLYVAYLLVQADKPSDFKYLSNIVKLTMLFGILYLLYFRSTITALL